MRETCGMSAVEGGLARLVDTAGFSEHDRDMATSGLCGTFALALKAVFEDIRLALLCPRSSEGHPLRTTDGGLQWRHAVALHGKDIVDIDGRVQFQDIVANYCWGAPSSAGGILVEVTETELTEILKSDRKSYDEGYLRRWSEMLALASTAQPEPVRSATP